MCLLLLLCLTGLQAQVQAEVSAQHGAAMSHLSPAIRCEEAAKAQLDTAICHGLHSMGTWSEEPTPDLNTGAL